MLLKELTLFRLYAPFLNETKRLKFNAYLRAFSENGSKLIKDHQKAHASHIKYCPVCVREDQQKYGETYWRRLFQTKSVLICPVHNVFLEECGVVPNRFFQSAECLIDNIPSPRRIDLQNPLHLFLKGLAEETAWLLDNDPQPASGSLSNQYLQIVKRHTFLPSTRTEAVRQISTELIGRQPPQLWSLFQHEFTSDNPQNWIMKVIYNPANQSPLSHLLFLVGLNVHLTDFMESPLPESKLFFNRPCLNPFCKYYRQPQIDTVKVSTSYNKVSKLIYACDCGFTYFRYPSNADKDIHYMDGIVKSDLNFLSKLFSKWFDSSISLQGIAEHLNVTTSNINDALRSHKIQIKNRLSEINYASENIADYWMHFKTH